MADKIKATEISKGIVLHWRDGYWQVTDLIHKTPGNLRAFLQVTMRNLKTGAQITERIGSNESIETAKLETTDMEFLYVDGENLVFMRQSDYEQIQIRKDLLGQQYGFLLPNMVCKVGILEGIPLRVELPFTVDLKVLETDPSLKGASVTNVYKAAKVETGATVNVPPFINIGDTVRIDTRDSKYIERVSN